MFDKFRRSWELTKQSYAVLHADKRLVLLPLVSGILSMLVAASFIVPMVVLGAAQASTEAAGGAAAAKSAEFEFKAIYLGIMFVAYFCSFSIISFFNAALVSCAMDHFDGKPVSIRAGLGKALSRLPQIAGWSLISATVGVVLQYIKEETGLIGRIVAGFLGLAWTIATFFVVPVLVVEGVGPIAAIKRSTSVVKKMWGEALIVNVGVSAAMGIIGLIGFLAIAGVTAAICILANSGWPALGGGALLIVFLITIGLVSSTLKGILVAATYRMAFTGQTPAGFDGGDLRQLFAEKKKR